MRNLENFRIEKQCPFCPMGKSDHIYKTFFGLYRHVFRWHALTDTGNHWWEGKSEEPIGYLRAFKVKFSVHEDIKVTGRKHVEALIEAYCSGIVNPSLRVADSSRLQELLGVKEWKIGKKE